MVVIPGTRRMDLETFTTVTVISVPVTREGIKVNVN